MGNTSTHNDINESNESVSYYYTTNRNVDLIDANLNYHKLNEYIEHITTPFKIINDNVEKEKLNFAINNCIIEESYYEQLQKVDALYNDMDDTYKSIFYSPRCN